MAKKIYVGNLSYTTTEETLKDYFSSYGEVLSSTVIKDRDTNQSKGFGFVELSDESNADKAIAELSGKEIDGRRIRVNYAEEKPHFNDGGNRRFERHSSKGGYRNFDGDRNGRDGSKSRYSKDSEY